MVKCQRMPVASAIVAHVAITKSNMKAFEKSMIGTVKEPRS